MIVIHVEYCQISFQLHSGRLLRMVKCGEFKFTCKLSNRGYYFEADN